MTMTDKHDGARNDAARRVCSSRRKTLGLYIHIPFCLRKCGYCAFCSYPLTSLGNDLRTEYFKKLIGQITSASRYCGGFTVDTVYIGGGTPSVMTADEYKTLLDAVFESYDVADDAEITSECNPGTVDVEKLKGMRRSGVNRLSFGFQSFNENELSALGRIHSACESEKAFYLAREAGFDNISADLMYGIPHQTMDSFIGSVKRLTALSPEHISSYALSVEEGTPFYESRTELCLPGEDETADMYARLSEYLSENGYRRYEISNFSVPGRESRHNLRYWKGTDYLGFGVSSHSYFNGARFSIKEDLGKYLDADFESIGNSFSAPVFENYGIVSAHDRMSEYVMLRLRLAEGFSSNEFFESFGISPWDFFDKGIGEYVKNGYMEFDGDRLRFTTKGFCVSNYILSDLIGFDNV